MAEASASFVLISILVVVAVLAVFAMKYASAAYRTRAEATRQTAADEQLAALRQEVSALAARVGTIEKLLREVE